MDRRVFVKHAAAYGAANLLVQADGSADTSFSLDPLLFRPGPLSLLDSAGTALVEVSIHGEWEGVVRSDTGEVV